MRDSALIIDEYTIAHHIPQQCCPPVQHGAHTVYKLQSPLLVAALTDQVDGISSGDKTQGTEDAQCHPHLRYTAETEEKLIGKC